MSHAPQTRKSLLLELGKHSEAAWSEFLLVYEDAIRRFCRAMGLQEADAWDATQDVLAAVHGRIASWNHDAEKGRFRAWLFRVARNVSVDVIAERARGTAARGGTEMELALAQLTDPSSPGTVRGEEAFDAEVQRALLAWAASQTRPEVKPATWEAFELTALRGVDAKEAAARLGTSVGSVYTAKCRVVARIRERVTQLSGEFPLSGDVDFRVAEEAEPPSQRPEPRSDHV